MFPAARGWNSWTCFFIGYDKIFLQVSHSGQGSGRRGFSVWRHRWQQVCFLQWWSANVYYGSSLIRILNTSFSSNTCSIWRTVNIPCSLFWFLCTVANSMKFGSSVLSVAWLSVLKSVFRIHRIHMFLGHKDPDPLVRGMNPDYPSIIKQK
jgi:hypothetical protein